MLFFYFQSIVSANAHNKKIKKGDNPFPEISPKKHHANI